MSEEKKQRKEIKLEIRADENVANGIYSNFIIANHSQTEFTLDFVFIPPQSKKAKVLSRIILNPTHAKRLSFLLNRQVESYEKRFGELEIMEQEPSIKVNSNDPQGFVN